MDDGGEEWRLILVGKAGSGKSATGNIILGRKEFDSRLQAKSTTVTCQKGRGSWGGRGVAVIDTPAILDSEAWSKELASTARGCIELSRPGPHALLLVTQVGRFTAEDAAAAKRVRDVFGPESARHTILLFTCKEDLGGDPLQEYVRGSDNAALQALIRQCGHRVCGFNNKAKGAEREGQVSELMGMVEEMVQENKRRDPRDLSYLQSSSMDAALKSYLGKSRAGWRWLFGIRRGSWCKITLMCLVLAGLSAFVYKCLQRPSVTGAKALSGP